MTRSTPKGPHIDCAGALAADRAARRRLLVLLRRAPAPARGARASLVPLLALATLARRRRACRSGSADERSRLVEGALRVDDLTLVADVRVLRRRRRRPCCCRGARAAPREAGARRVLRAAADARSPAWSCSSRRRTSSRCSSGSSCCRSRSTCCARPTCAASTSLESGLKYLIIGSVGSATLLYGLALHLRRDRARPTSRASRARRRASVADDPLLLTGIALTVVGLAFKASVAPFHQWTPDVYEGAPTPVTAFMAVATKAAAFASSCASSTSRCSTPATTGRRRSPRSRRSRSSSGNVGAIGADLAEAPARVLVGGAGRLHAGRRRRRDRGSACRRRSSTSLVYLFMNMAAFAVIVARERETGAGRRHRLGARARRRRARCWPGR